MDDGPHVVVIAGPNGAGKSTAASLLLHGFLQVEEFVNADAIARGLSEFNPEAVAFEAGRIMLQRLDQLAKERKHFAFETTLASKTFGPWIEKLKLGGYLFKLVFLWLPTSELAQARVIGRVRTGGHSVPKEVIARRYLGGIRNFFRIYQPIADFWRVYDSSETRGPRCIAEGRHSEVKWIYDPDSWQRFEGFNES